MRSGYKDRVGYARGRGGAGPAAPRLGQSPRFYLRCPEVLFCAASSCRRTRRAICRSGYLCFGTMLASDFGLLNLNFSVLLLLLTLGGVQAVCPYCFGNFASCTYDTNKLCPTIDVPAANAAVVAAGAGVLTLAKIIKPRFLRALSTVSFDTILALVKRAEPGAAFDFDKNTPSTTLLTAVANGRVNPGRGCVEALRVHGARGGQGGQG